MDIFMTWLKPGSGPWWCTVPTACPLARAPSPPGWLGRSVGQWRLGCCSALMGNHKKHELTWKNTLTILVDCHNLLILLNWILRPEKGMISLNLTMIPMRSQWGRYNLPRSWMWGCGFKEAHGWWKLFGWLLLKCCWLPWEKGCNYWCKVADCGDFVAKNGEVIELQLFIYL